MKLFIMNVPAFCILFGVLVCMSCGLFSPRTAEKPLNSDPDPLRLTTIVNGTTLHFSKPGYEDNFSDTIMYDDDQSLTPKFSRNRIVDRLKMIITNDTNIFVKWEKNPDKPDYLHLPYYKLVRIYNIWLNAQDTIIHSDTGDFYGESTFDLIKTNTDDLMIVLWTDIPGYDTALSYFSPDYGN